MTLALPLAPRAPACPGQAAYLFVTIAPTMIPAPTPTAMACAFFQNPQRFFFKTTIWASSAAITRSLASRAFRSCSTSDASSVRRFFRPVEISRSRSIISTSSFDSVPCAAISRRAARNSSNASAHIRRKASSLTLESEVAGFGAELVWAWVVFPRLTHSTLILSTSIASRANRFIKFRLFCISFCLYLDEF